MINLQNTVLGELLDAQRQADAMVRRAQALQVDPLFWVPGVEPNRFDCLPLWHCICAFKGMDPAYWALTSPAVAASWERHTTGEVAARLKELVQLHTRALGGIKMELLKAPGNETKGFETNLFSLIEWAEKVGEGTSTASKLTTPETPGNEPEIKALQRGNAQDELILKTICEMKYEPKQLPQNPAGKPGVKADVREALKNNQLFTGSTVFDHAWERLRKFGDIVTVKVSRVRQLNA